MEESLIMLRLDYKVKIRLDKQKSGCTSNISKYFDPGLKLKNKSINPI